MSCEFKLTVGSARHHSASLLFSKTRPRVLFTIKGGVSARMLELAELVCQSQGGDRLTVNGLDGLLAMASERFKSSDH